MKRVVEVNAGLFEVSVYQVSEGAWEAAGAFTSITTPGAASRDIRVTGSSEEGAFNEWARVAEGCA